MELKNIFEMAKTDRYTQDGRDELAKLQETEDVTYKTGDISQKTGLQKQPDGSWAPPKKGTSKLKVEKRGNSTYYYNTEKSASKPMLGYKAGTKYKNEKGETLEITEVTPEKMTYKKNGEEFSVSDPYKFQDEEIDGGFRKDLSENSGDKTLNKSWKQSDIISELPEGWKRVEGATTAPNGYVVVSNNESRFGGGRETKLMKEEEFKKATEANAKMDYIMNNYTPGGGQSTINFLSEQARHLREMGPYGESKFQEVMKLIDKEEKAMAEEENLPDFVKSYKLLSEEHDQDAMESNAKLYPELQPLVKQRGPFVQKRIAAYTKLRDNPSNPKARADFVDASNAIAQIDADIDRAYKKATGENEGNSYWGTRAKNERTATLVDWLDDWDKNPEEKDEEAYAAIEKELASRGVNRAGRQDAKEADNAGRNEFYRRAYEGDAAPRQLTGDCRIRIRKEKPKLTGDTKIRIRK